MNEIIKINDNERKVLEKLAEIYSQESDCYYFAGIAKDTGLDVKQVRRSCRSLAKKGLAEYVRGLFDEDGMAAGSGYRATTAGYELIEKEKNVE